MYSPEDQYISICWQRAFGRSTGRDSVAVTQIPLLIRELKEFVGTPDLFTKSELNILQSMANKRPSLRLKKLEVQRFLLQLVGAKSMESFLKDRARLGVGALRKLVDNYPVDVDLRDRETRPSIKQEESAMKREELPREDDTWLGRWWRSDLLSKIPSFRASESGSSTSNNLGRRDMFSSIRDAFPGAPEPHIKKEPYESRTEHETRRRHDNSTYRPTRTAPGSFQEPNTLQDRIRELELLCKKYERELEASKYSRSDLQQERLMANLKDLLREQESVIRSLKSRIDSQNIDTSGVVGSMPFIKQWSRIMSRKTTDLSIREVVLEIISVVLTFFVAVNLLKLVYYSVLTIVTRSKPSNFYFDISDDETTISFSWLRQIPWLEYKLYQIQDWWEG